MGGTLLCIDDMILAAGYPADKKRKVKYTLGRKFYRLEGLDFSGKVLYARRAVGDRFFLDVAPAAVVSQILHRYVSGLRTTVNTGEVQKSEIQAVVKELEDIAIKVWSCWVVS